jgi:hypothetical protein
MEDAQEQQKSNKPWLEQYKFQPGQSGNPGGRRKGSRNLTARLREIVEREAKDGKDYGDLVMEALVKAAKKGDVKAIAIMLDRIDGKLGSVETDDSEQARRINIPESDARSEQVDPG